MKSHIHCQYFGKCGGCKFLDLVDYAQFKFRLAESKLASICNDISSLISIAPNTRRRAAFKVSKSNKLSFNKLASKDVVDINSCPLLQDKINLLIPPINAVLKKLSVQINYINITNSDTGIEILLFSKEKNNLDSDVLLTEFANQNNIARIAWQIGKSPFTILQRSPVQLLVNNFKIDLPINSFLQVSKESEEIMANIIIEHLDNEKTIELYSGCGSFTITISTKAQVLAIEGNTEAVSALKNTAKNYNLPIKTREQDLFQLPIKAEEINHYQQIVINPPRNGASPQVKQIALSTAKKVIMISCSLNNFVRDAYILLDNGFILEKVYPIDQFLYTEHLEIIGVFIKKDSCKRNL